MKILMVGAGAVGGYFGTLLYQSGNDITFLVRERTFEAIKERGITVESFNGNITVQPKLIRSAESNQSFDLIILAVKCYDLEEVFKEIEPVVSAHTVILTLQNGIDTEERATAHFGKGNIIGGVVFITAKLIEKGRIGHYKRGMMTIGELNGEKSQRLAKVYEVLTHARITTYMTGEIMKKKWEKLCWNATFNPLSVLMDGSVSKVLESPGALSVIRGVIQEIIQVARQYGITLKESIVEDTILASYELKDYHTSMFEDWKGGKITENRYLNGMICEKGDSVNISTPLNFILFQAVNTLTRDKHHRND